MADKKKYELDIHRYRVESGKKFNLSSYATDESLEGLTPEEGKKLLKKSVKKLAKLQELLYAQASWSVLLQFQAMDAGGKDGTIKHVMSGVNPQGVRVSSFKQPGPLQLSHDFLWRAHFAVPDAGRIGIFNRSYYEEVLVTKVHPEILKKQKIPSSLVMKKGFWADRYEDIRNFESYLSNQGVIVLKFFLHISKEEQRRRLLARLDTPEKLWKFSVSDMKERMFWDQYQVAYNDAIMNTATPEAPWYIIPADKKWYARLVVVEALIDVLKKLKMTAPEPAEEIMKYYNEIKTILQAEEAEQK